MITSSAPDAMSALDVLRQAVDTGAVPDVAVLDRHMPGVDGLELCRLVAADPPLDPMQIVVLTSAVSSRSGGCERVAAYLTKPVRQGELIDTLVGVLARRSDAPPVARPSPEGPARPGPGAARVLVAEDNSVNQKVAAAMLHRLGYQVDVVANGREAVEAVERIPYAAVLMDCQMPEMNGYEASTEIRRREGTSRHIPIVALTASAIKGDEERCLAAGMDAYVTKPVHVDGLGAVLGELISTVGTGPARAVLDQDTLTELLELGGSPPMLEQVVAAFLESAPADIAAVRDALAAAHLADVARTAHRLKGSCAVVGATAMGAIAGDIEAAASDGQDADLPGLVTRLQRSFAEARAALDAAVDVPLAEARRP